MWGGPGGGKKKETHTFFPENVTRDLGSSRVWNPPQERPYMEPCCLFSHPYKESAASAPLLFLSNKHKHKGDTKTKRVQVAAGSRSFKPPPPPPIPPRPPSFSPSLSLSMTSGTIWLGTAAPADASDLRGAAHCALIGLRVESFRWKRVSQGTFGKRAGRCAHEPASESVQKPGFMHSTSTSAASLPSSFVREHLACGGAIGFHDVGMHTSASATGSALPATDGLDNDPRAGRPCEASAPLAAAVTSSFLVPALPPFQPFCPILL